MPQITLMIGPPGSGKTTEAQRYLEVHNLRYDLVRINQDEQGKEGHMDEFEKALSRGYDIIIDRMNFDKKQRSRYLEPARKVGYTTRIIILHVSKSICLERCNSRIDHPTIKDPESASRAVNFFFSNYERVSDDEADEVMRLGWVDVYAPKCIWSDLDGTLADVEHRRHHIRPTVEQFSGDPREIPTEPKKFKRNWKAFFEEMVLDPVDPVCGAVLKEFSDMYPIVYATGRPDNYKQQTETWLIENGFRFPGSSLFMRTRNDTRKDDIIKEIILEFEVKTRYNVFFALDDRNQVVDMLRRHGVKVLQVEEGAF